MLCANNAVLWQNKSDAPHTIALQPTISETADTSVLNTDRFLSTTESDKLYPTTAKSLLAYCGWDFAYRLNSRRLRCLTIAPSAGPHPICLRVAQVFAAVAGRVDRYNQNQRPGLFIPTIRLHVVAKLYFFRTRR